MLLSFLLGLMGSLGHCVGMCGGVALLLSRRGVTSSRWSLLLVHLGRITTYSFLGVVAGTLGQTVRVAFSDLRQWQGVLALAIAGLAVYLALALLGRAPSPEIYLAGLTQRWGRAMQRLLEQRPTFLHLGTLAPPLLLGLVWGLLPCGLVLTALLTAAAGASPWDGALVMFAFGSGTLPALVSMSWVTRRVAWPRPLAAGAVLLFGTQMALRGLAAWGWVGHLHLGGWMLW